MVLSTSYDLAETIRQADLLKPAQLIKLAAEILPNVSEDPQELAFALIQRGWLTSFQAEQVLNGKARQLNLGGYRLLEPLGAGGMGQVYKAWQKRLSRTVALKVIRPELIKDNPRAVHRFKREALAVAQLSHPNIVAIYDADEADGTHFIVLEYVDGPDLEKLVVDGGPLPVKLAAEYARQAALGLQHASEAGLVHRDIKPSNLLIAGPEAGRRTEASSRAGAAAYGPGLVKILDMGLARMESIFESKASLTREGSMMGTPDYVAPEQARDASSVDIRADLYSLGCTIYFLLAARPPFPDGTMMEKLIKHHEEEPTPIEQLRPDVPAALGDIIRRLMAKSPERRYQSPIELAEALMPIPELVPVAVMPQFPAPAPAAPASAPTPVSPPTPPDSRVLPRAATPTASETPPEVDPRAIVTVVTALSLQEVNVKPDQQKLHALLAPAQKIAVLRGHKGPVMGVAFSADSSLLATGGVDATVHIWGLGPSPRNIAVLQEPLLGDVHQLGFAPSGDYLITGSASLEARMVKWAWGEPPGRDRLAVDGPSSSDALAFSPDGLNLASAVGPSVWLWTAGSGAPRRNTVIKSPTGDVKALQFSPDSGTLASGDTGGAAHLWKLNWLGKRPSATLAGHEGAVSCVTFSPDGKTLATAGKDYTVRVWDISGSVVKEKAILEGTKGAVRRMLFLPESDMLLTACDGGQVILWKWPVAQRHYEWRLEQPIVCSLALSTDGSFVAAGCSDGTVAVYDLVPEGA